MRYLYEKAATPASGLRLHLNENTGGCSPAVVEALRGITPEAAACYPDYADAIAAVSARFHVPDSHLVLTNGLDEGILAASLAALRPGQATGPAEAVVIVPAFDMQAACAEAAGAGIVEVPLEADFTFPLKGVLASIGARTRIIFITSPNNPTGISVPRESVEVIAAAAPGAMVFVDEAYADFSDSTLIGDPVMNAHPNIVVGRTFSKAYGLAALRGGALVAAPAALAPIRRVLPPYSINVAAAVAIPAALRDHDHHARYLAEVRESKRLLYDALDRMGVQYWVSDANFVLARFGEGAGRICEKLRQKGIYVRDRSKVHGCQGCVRITTGVVEHTRRFIETLEEVLCAAR
jgi:histidinol-phosphate aminotransferase